MPVVTGFKFPTTDAAVSGTWTTPTSVQADDNNDATVAPGKNTTASRDAGGFGLSIPAGATITKVEIKNNYWCSVTTSIATFRFNAKVGATVLANHDDATEPTAETSVTLDITADRAWVPADFADGTFFVRFNAVQGNSSTAVTFHFDAIQVQVTYLMLPGEDDDGAARLLHMCFSQILTSRQDAAARSWGVAVGQQNIFPNDDQITTWVGFDDDSGWYAAQDRLLSQNLTDRFARSEQLLAAIEQQSIYPPDDDISIEPPLFDDDTGEWFINQSHIAPAIWSREATTRRIQAGFRTVVPGDEPEARLRILYVYAVEFEIPDVFKGDNDGDAYTPLNQFVWPNNFARVPLGQSDEFFSTLAQASQDVSLEFNVIANIGENAAIIFVVRSLTAGDLDTDWNVHTLVNEDAGATFNERALSSEDTSINWNDRAVSSQDAQILANILALINRSASSVWNIKTLTAQPATAVWNVLQNIYQDAGKTWSILQNMSESAGIVWHDLELVTRSATEVWDTKELISRSPGLYWDIRQVIAHDAVDVWNVRSLISRDVGALFDIFGLSMRSAGVLWNTKSLVNRSPVSVWNVRELVARSAGAEWNMFAHATHDLNTLWNTLKLTSEDADIEWDDHSLVTTLAGRNAILNWKVRQLLSVDASGYYNIFSNVTRSASSEWETRSLIDRDATLRYATKALVDRDASLRYFVHTSLHRDMGSEWNLRKLADTDATVWFNTFAPAHRDAVVRFITKELTAHELNSDWAVRTMLGQEVELEWMLRKLVSSGANVRFGWAVFARLVVIHAFRDIVTQAIFKDLPKRVEFADLNTVMTFEDITTAMESADLGKVQFKDLATKVEIGE